MFLSCWCPRRSMFALLMKPSSRTPSTHGWIEGDFAARHILREEDPVRSEYGMPE